MSGATRVEAAKMQAHVPDAPALAPQQVFDQLELGNQDIAHDIASWALARLDLKPNRSQYTCHDAARAAEEAVKLTVRVVHSLLGSPVDLDHLYAAEQAVIAKLSDESSGATSS